MSWTDERLEKLRQLWPLGYSAARIADEIGPPITRDAVIGKVARLGLAQRETTVAARRTAPKPQPERIKLKSDGTVAPYFARTPLPEEPAVLDPSTNCTLFELRPNSCRWPIGHPGTPEFRFCGARQTTRLRPTGNTAEVCKSPYCEAHHRLAYSRTGPISEQHRQAIAISRRRQVTQRLSFNGSAPL